ncbi:MAG TPA: site-2 protease family protein [Clostridia bacterium]|nr:site-2 protease family protein [Clostridia bacterium]
MLINLFRHGLSLQTLMGVLAAVFVVFCTLPVHEYAHAYVATKLGDPTPRLSGRLTLNPLAHIDPMGALMIMLVGFGYAKPVQVNMRNFKNAKRDMALTALAGPMSNILMAFVFILLINVFTLISISSGSTISQVSIWFFYYAASINIFLAVFNLLPIPPLDGSRVISAILPNKYYYKIMQYERYIVLVVFALLIMGVLSAPLTFLSDKIYSALAFLAGLPFKAFFR